MALRRARCSKLAARAVQQWITNAMNLMIRHTKYGAYSGTAGAGLNLAGVVIGTYASTSLVCGFCGGSDGSNWKS